MTETIDSYLLEQLSRAVPNIRSRKMFGGIGIYSGELFFALIDEDTLYFKVGDSNRPRFEGAGMQPFRPTGEQGAAMQYYQVPEGVIEDLDSLREWAESALTVAANKTTKRRKKP